MLQKIKDFGAVIAAGIAAILGVVAYFFYKKNKDVDALKAQVALAETQKQADVLDAQINEHKENKATLQKEVDELAKVQVQLDNKRQELAKDQQGKSADEVEDYWKKN